MDFTNLSSTLSLQYQIFLNNFTLNRPKVSKGGVVQKPVSDNWDRNEHI